MYVGTHIYVNGVTAGGHYRCCWRKYVESRYLYAITLVEVRSPERRVHKSHSLKLHIVAALNKYQPRTHFIKIGTLTVIFATYPELFPVTQSVTIDGSLARESEAIAINGIYQSGKILEILPLHSGIDKFKVAYKVTALENRAFLYMQMCTRFEEERTAEECSFGDYHHTTTVGCGIVNDILNLYGLQQGAVLLHAIVGDYILLAQCIHIQALGFGKPLGHDSAIGPQILGIGMHAAHKQQQGKHAFLHKHLLRHEKLCTEITLSRVGQEDDNPLSLVLGAKSYLKGSMDGSPAADAHKQSLSCT